MFKCRNCNTLFDKTDQVEQDTGEIFSVCPECHDTDYDEVWQCRLCEDYFFADDITRHTCHECAKEKYNVHLGLKYIGQNKEDFYLRYIWGIDHMDKDKESDLVDIVEDDFIDEIDFEDDWNNHLKDLKSYCLDDIDSWIEFLEEEV